jgi:hypothetical protein
MNEGDKLHPTLNGYQIWADAAEADFPRAARPTSVNGPRTDADGRSERCPQSPVGARKGSRFRLSTRRILRLINVERGC